MSAQDTLGTTFLSISYLRSASTKLFLSNTSVDWELWIMTFPLIKLSSQSKRGNDLLSDQSTPSNTTRENPIWHVSLSQLPKKVLSRFWTKYMIKVNIFSCLRRLWFFFSVTVSRHYLRHSTAIIEEIESKT